MYAQPMPAEVLPAHRDVVTLAVTFLAFWLLIAALFTPWFAVSFTVPGFGTAEESAAPFDDIFPSSPRIKGSKAMLIIATIFCAFAGAAMFARNSFVASLCLWGSTTAAFAGLMLFFQQLKGPAGQCQIKEPSTGSTIGTITIDLWNAGTTLFMIGGMLVMLAAILSMRHSPSFVRNAAVLVTIFVSITVIVLITTQPTTDTCDFLFFGRAR